jgi:hypothetical protein
MLLDTYWTVDLKAYTSIIICNKSVDVFFVYSCKCACCQCMWWFCASCKWSLASCLASFWTWLPIIHVHVLLVNTNTDRQSFPWDNNDTYIPLFSLSFQDKNRFFFVVQFWLRPATAHTCTCSYKSLGWNIRGETADLSYVIIVFYDKVRGRNKAQRWLLLVCCGFFIWKRYNQTHFHRTILWLTLTPLSSTINDRF